MTENDGDPNEVTDWFSGAVHPAQEGVYERRVSDGSFSCWNGRSWNRDADTPADAAGAVEPSRDQNASWRGLKAASALPCATCKGHTVVDRGFDVETGADLLVECPDC
ncbi:MAG: hypothetical protein ABI277_04650 [Burkholderiaceae bacterium]